MAWPRSYLNPESPQLVESWQRLVRAVVKHTKLPWQISRQEAFAAGLVAVWKALPRYDPNRDKKLVWWLRDKIQWAITDEVRAHFGRYGPKTFPRLQRKDEPVVSREPGFDHIEDEDEVETRLAQLGPRERQFLRLYYLQEKSLREIGRIMGKTEACMSLWLKAIRYRLEVLRTKA